MYWIYDLPNWLFELLTIGLFVVFSLADVLPTRRWMLLAGSTSADSPRNTKNSDITSKLSSLSHAHGYSPTYMSMPQERTEPLTQIFAVVLLITSSATLRAQMSILP